MNSNEKQQTLLELKSKKELALAQSVKYFPPQFYAFSEICLTNPRFEPIIKEILRENQKDNADYHNIIQKVESLINSIHKGLLKHIENVEVVDSITNQIQSFPTNQTKNVVLIFQQAWHIKNILQALRHDPKLHDNFLKKIANKITLLEQTLEELSEENHYARRMERKSIWGSLQRIYRIYFTYDPKVYKSVRNELITAGRGLDVITLDVQYEGLKKCIDPESDTKLCYDENFDMTADKLAIQNIYAYIEGKLIECNITNSQQNKKNSKIIVIDKNQKYLQISVDGEPRDIQLKSDREKVISFFSKNHKCSGEKLCQIITGDKFQDWGKDESKKVKNIVKNINKYFNKEFDIQAALNIKSIPSHHVDKIEISKNPLHW